MHTERKSARKESMEDMRKNSDTSGKRLLETTIYKPKNGMDLEALNPWLPATNDQYSLSWLYFRGQVQD